MSHKITTKATCRPVSKVFSKTSDNGNSSIISDLLILCRRIASLDDAGLDVFAKSCIADARKLLKRINQGDQP